MIIATTASQLPNNIAVSTLKIIIIAAKIVDITQLAKDAKASFIKMFTIVFIIVCFKWEAFTSLLDSFNVDVT